VHFKVMLKDVRDADRGFFTGGMWWELRGYDFYLSEREKRDGQRTTESRHETRASAVPLVDTARVQKEITPSPLDERPKLDRPQEQIKVNTDVKIIENLSVPERVEISPPPSKNIESDGGWRGESCLKIGWQLGRLGKKRLSS
jgi:hypothetical protein